MKEGNQNKRRSCILKFFLDLPSQDEYAQVLQVFDKAVLTLVDLAETTDLGDHNKLGNSIASVLQECNRSRELIEERQRLK